MTDVLAEGRPSRTARESLTGRAGFTAAALLLDYVAKIGVGLLVTPVIVAGLGRSMYGIWEMLNKLVGYMSAADGRPTDALRLIVANQQATADHRSQRRHVGSAIAVWLLFFPLVAGAGAALTWLTPTITRVSPALAATVRWACALLVASFLCNSLSAIPESVLRGMNLGYRRMGLQASLNLVNGVLMAGAVWVGLGLPGVAGAQAVTWLLTGLCFWFLSRKYVGWFGVERPRREDIRRMVGVSGWLAAGELVSKLLLASDVVVLGMLINPALVASYALTGYAAKTATGVLSLAVAGAMPGLGGVLGEGDRQRARALRREMQTLTWLIMTAGGATILLWNRSFIALWVGQTHYAGPVVDALILLCAVQTAFIRTDAYVIDAAVRPRQRVLVGVAAALSTVTLEVLLTRIWGAEGLCLGLLAGRAIQTIGYPMIVEQLLRLPDAGASSLPFSEGLFRPLAVTAVLFAGSAYLGVRVLAAHWVTWVPGVIGTVFLATAIAFPLGLSPDLRRSLWKRMRAIRRLAPTPW